MIIAHKRPGIAQMLKCFISFSVLLMLAAPAHAGVCDSKAASIASRQGGKVLSAQDRGKKCRIKILVQKPNKPPKRRTIVVSK